MCQYAFPSKKIDIWWAKSGHKIKIRAITKTDALEFLTSSSCGSSYLAVLQSVNKLRVLFLSFQHVNCFDLTGREFEA